jgi:hypothetical protein
LGRKKSKSQVKSEAGNKKKEKKKKGFLLACSDRLWEFLFLPPRITTSKALVDIRSPPSLSELFSTAERYHHINIVSALFCL